MAITRQIDDLGRVCIPKEIRRELRIREGDSFECYTSSDGAVVFRKYSPIKCIKSLASQLCESTFNAWGFVAVVTDRDCIIATPDVTVRELREKRICQEIVQIMDSYHCYQHDGKFNIFVDDEEKYLATTIMPIIFGGDLLGSVVVIGEQGKMPDRDIEWKVSKTIASFLGMQMKI